MRRLKIIGGLAAGVIFIITLGANYFILTFSDGIIRNPEKLPTAPVALVFGGGMKDDQTMSEMQTDRVKRSVELYKNGKVGRLIMTGDDGARNFDEVHAMQAYAIDAGVPASAVSVDPHGYRTYESCYRAAKIYGVTTTIAVSQEFHLARIVYLCRSMGLTVFGAPADLRNYGWNAYIMAVREVLARVKAVWQMEITKPLPRVTTL